MTKKQETAKQIVAGYNKAVSMGAPPMGMVGSLGGSFGRFARSIKTRGSKLDTPTKATRAGAKARASTVSKVRTTQRGPKAAQAIKDQRLLDDLRAYRPIGGSKVRTVKKK